MEFSNTLRYALDEVTKDYKVNDLKKALDDVTKRYMDEKRDGKTMLNNITEAVAYANVRMAATYFAISHIASKLYDKLDMSFASLIDVGSGTGAALWALDNFYEFDNIYALEREAAMQSVGKKLVSYASSSIKNAEWIDFDISNNELEKKADLVIASYMINELDESKRVDVAKKIFYSANRAIIIVETGTMAGARNINMIRSALIDLGGQVILPCPTNDECPISDNDWCHFTTRVPRLKIHKMLKGGDVPYEDEKFSYLVVLKEKSDDVSLASKRIMRHPKVMPGRIETVCCTKDGIKNEVYLKKDENFKRVKKLSCGDEI